MFKIILSSILISLNVCINLNSNNFSSYDIKSFNNTLYKNHQDLIFNSKNLSILEYLTGKVFKSYKEKIIDKIIILDLLKDLKNCKLEMKNLNDIFIKNMPFTPSYLYEVKNDHDIVIKCPICKYNEKNIIWIKKNFQDSTSNYFYYNRNNTSNYNRTFVGKNNSLFIKRFQPPDSGIYMCIEINSTLELDWNEIETMFKINIYLFYSFKQMSKMKYLKIENNLNISAYSRINKFERFKKIKIANNLIEAYNGTEIEFYLLWSRWSQCKDCRNRYEHHRFKFREAECRVQFNNLNDKKYLITLYQRFFPVGIPCSYLNTYDNFLSFNTLYSNIPANLIEIKNCTCPEKVKSNFCM